MFGDGKSRPVNRVQGDEERRHKIMGHGITGKVNEVRMDNWEHQKMDGGSRNSASTRRNMENGGKRRGIRSATVQHYDLAEKIAKR